MPSLQENIATIPTTPGIYLMKDSFSHILYVGKAISLRRRVSSYFKANALHSPKIANMVQLVSSIDFVVTKNETEALVLENHYIKAYMPKYNTRLRDQKTYPYLKITSEEFPRLLTTRKRLADRARYFGPYVSSWGMGLILETIREHFPLRRCKKLVRGKGPCLYYHIQKCQAPCIGKVDKEQYQKWIEDIIYILEGKYGKLFSKLDRQMKEFSAALEFEKAALIRDQLDAIRILKEKQAVENLDSTKNYDYFMLLPFDEHAVLQVFRIKEGCLIQTISFELDTGIESSEDQLLSAVLQFYEENLDWPDEVVLSMMPESQTFIDVCLEHKTKVVSAQQPKYEVLMDSVRENAFHSLKRTLLHREDIAYENISAELKHSLRLSLFPKTIMGVDISHLGGEDIVASAVLFEQGVPQKSGYRRFNIKTVAYNDDFASIAEVVTRLCKAWKKEGRPDLILIDGGLGQLHSAMTAMKQSDMEIKNIVSLAKKDEILYSPDNNDGVKLDQRNSGLKLLMQVRDEAHRFAITFQRSKRKKIFYE